MKTSLLVIVTVFFQIVTFREMGFLSALVWPIPIFILSIILFKKDNIKGWNAKLFFIFLGSGLLGDTFYLPQRLAGGHALDYYKNFCESLLGIVVLSWIGWMVFMVMCAFFQLLCSTRRSFIDEESNIYKNVSLRVGIMSGVFNAAIAGMIIGGISRGLSGSVGGGSLSGFFGLIGGLLGISILSKKTLSITIIAKIFLASIITGCIFGFIAVFFSAKFQIILVLWFLEGFVGGIIGFVTGCRLENEK